MGRITQEPIRSFDDELAWEHVVGASIDEANFAASAGNPAFDTSDLDQTSSSLARACLDPLGREQHLHRLRSRELPNVRAEGQIGILVRHW